MHLQSAKRHGIDLNEFKIWWLHTWRMSQQIRQATRLLNVKFWWLPSKSRLAAARPTSNARISVGTMSKFLIDSPELSSNSPSWSGMVICLSAMLPAYRCIHTSRIINLSWSAKQSWQWNCYTCPASEDFWTVGSNLFPSRQSISQLKN